MQNNVIYGAFGQTTTRAPSIHSDSSVLAPAGETPSSLQERLRAQIKVLNDLSELIQDPNLPKEIADPLQKEIAPLFHSANDLLHKVARSTTDDRAFLEIQTELKTFSEKLIDFEATVLHKTGAEIELVEGPPPPALAQVRDALGSPKKWLDSPKFWIGASVGVAALSGLVWWFVQKEKPEKEDFSKSVTRVKLKRALPAR